MSKSYDEAKPRIPTQRDIVLNELRNAGKYGITNLQLNKVCQRWSARIQELYVMGYEITNRHIGNGVYEYVLVSEPENPCSPKPESALDIVLAEIGSDFISAKELQMILECYNFNITRKAGTHKLVLDNNF